MRRAQPIFSEYLMNSLKNKENLYSGDHLAVNRNQKMYPNFVDKNSQKNEINERQAAQITPSQQNENVQVSVHQLGSGFLF